MSLPNFKVPDALRMGAVRLRVHDLGQMLNFYQGFLGLEVLSSEAGQVALGFPAVGVLVELEQDTDAIDRPANAAGLYHFALLSSGRVALAHALRRLIDSGYPLQGLADHFVSEAIYLADPEGNGIEIYADRPRDQWEWEESKVRIGTIPLDVDSLLSTVDQADRGAAVLDQETRMGHVHLQVINLQAAMGFYGTVLGFDSMGLYGSSAAFYSAGGYHHHIGLNTWMSEGGNVAGERMLGLVEFELVFPAEHDMVALLRTAPGLNPDKHQSIETIRVIDPSGNTIRIRRA